LATLAAVVPDLVPSTESRLRFYRPELDALRFVAFFAVFVCHALPHDLASYTSQHVPTILGKLLAAIGQAGRFGVDLFFLLSAYLITSLLIREQLATGTVDLKAFYVRRILRIWPLYFFALLIAVLWRFVDATEAMPSGYAVAYLLLAGNWMSALIGPPTSFMGILWSVSIEEQFYLSWPVLLKRVNRSAILWVAFVLLAISNLTRIYLATGPLSERIIWFNTLTRLDPIAIGIALAVILPEAPRWGLALRYLLTATGLTLLTLCGHYFAATSLFTIVGYPVAALGTVFLFLAAIGSDLSHRPLVYLGKISYGLYVWHALCLYLASYFIYGRFPVRFGFALRIIVAFLATLAISAASYHFLETPFLKLKERFTKVHSRPV
jgi:peptidoglycan/LPS O-acetylase OafA/YrhL